MKSKLYIPLLSLLMTMGFQHPLRAQNAQASLEPHFYDWLLVNGLLLFASLVIVAAVTAILRLMSLSVKMQRLQIYQKEGIEAIVNQKKEARESIWSRLYKRWTRAVPLEKEEDILFEHSFDGIRELDNSLPPWWVAMFYLTIIIGVVYFSYYHILGYGPSSAERYQVQIEKAEQGVQAYLASQANLVDETNVSLLEAEEQLALGKSIYDANCLACHGAFGEGGVGPNLTDKYWIHGGSITDVFSTIKYGVPEKGMIAWQSQLRASEIQQVTSYIMGMQGTQPPNAKEPQGQIYSSDPVIEASDTTLESSRMGMLK